VRVTMTRRLGFGLSREMWLIEAGIFLNMLGYGAVLPFEVIYLHNGRGFGLGVAGLVVGTLTGVAVVAAPFAGPVIDRHGARVTAVGAGAALTAGYAGLAFCRSPAQAFAAAALAGAGNGALNPAQSALVATLVTAGMRHRATAVSRVATNAGIGIGGALGGVVAAYGLAGFVALFLANAITYLGYVCVLAALVREPARPDRIAGGYRTVLGDRAFVHLAVTTVAMTAVGWGVFTWLLPPYARNGLGISARLIGLLLLANAATVVVAQVPVARFAEGRRRVAMMAVAAVLFTAACLLVLAAGHSPGIAYAELVTAVVLIGAGECFFTTTLTPLVADLAPAALRGRYMASIGLCWWAGLAVAPTLGLQLLSRSAAAAFITAAAVAAAAGVSALALDRRLPAPSRLTPRPGSSATVAHSGEVSASPRASR
jgi:MFS family permease